ncbi:unnamed protein product, partial [Allacma fusca]
DNIILVGNKVQSTNLFQTMRLLRIPKFYHPAFSRHHEVAHEHHFFNCWKLQEKYWTVHHPQAGNEIPRNKNIDCNQESVHEIYNSRLKRFEKRVKLLTKLQNYYGIFLRGLPPYQPHNRNVQINHIQVSCPSSRSFLTTATSSLTNKSSLSKIPVTNGKRVGKSKNKRRKLALSHNYEQTSTNYFFGDKKIIKIENINTRFAESAREVLQPCGQMGDFFQAESTNFPFELRPQQQQQHDESTDLSSLLFTPVCTSVICADQNNNLLKLRYSGVERESKKGEISRNTKEQKLKRAKQLCIVQKKLQQDQLRQTLEFNPELDKDWLVISRELCDYKGKMTTLKRTIQYIHDDEIIIHQSLERPFQHRKLQDSVQDISNFVESLNLLNDDDSKPNKGKKKHISPSEFTSIPSLPPAQIHQQRISELCHPDTIRANKMVNLDRINSFSLRPPSTKKNSSAAAKGKASICGELIEL